MIRNIKVKIKTFKEIKKISTSSIMKGEYSLSEGDVYFVDEMIPYCEKVYDLEFFTYISKKIKVYKIVKHQRIDDHSFSWSNWMFDILPEVENKNYLLEF